MDDRLILAAASAIAFLVTFGGTRFLSRILAARGIMDLPNQRSSHHRATPRGGGIAVIAGIVAGGIVLVLAGTPMPTGVFVVAPAALFLALISWIDDVRGLPAVVRFAAHALCVGVSLYLLGTPAPSLLGALPEPAQFVLMALAWLWFLNLYNFMDGIDGITGIETLTITLGVAAVLAVALGSHPLIPLALIAAAAMPGFLIWNWPPAKIFMGDVGSVPLGFLLGWMLIVTAHEGFPIPALLIPAYYLGDATLTLIRRAARGEKIWQAHREHAYQKAVHNGMTHGAVSARVGALGAVLTGLAVLSLHYPVAAALAAVVIVAAAIRHFSRHAA